MRPSPSTASLCRLPRAPAARWWFPTLSPQSLPRCLDPYPAATSRCIDPFLPGRHRPHVTFDTFGSRDLSLQSNFNRAKISGLQSFHHVQAPMLARPPGCTYRILRWAAGPFTPRHEPEVPLRNCGITTCLNRVIGTTGLSPAGLRPCRPLHKRPFVPRAAVR